MDSLSQPDYLDGKLIHVDDQEVQLEENGTLYKCTAAPEITAALRPHLHGSTLRAFGTATWTCRPDGRWELQAFSIENFIPLEDKTLEEVLK